MNENDLTLNNNNNLDSSYLEGLKNLEAVLRDLKGDIHTGIQSSYYRDAYESDSDTIIYNHNHNTRESEDEDIKLMNTVFTKKLYKYLEKVDLSDLLDNIVSAKVLKLEKKLAETTAELVRLEKEVLALRNIVINNELVLYHGTQEDAD